MRERTPIRCTALIATCALLGGCQSQRSSVDPFLGRTTIPPPGTGIPQQSGQYYPAAPQVEFAPGSQIAPPTAPATPVPHVSPGANPYVPPGGYHYQGSSVPSSMTGGIASNAPAAGSGAVAGQPLGNGSWASSHPVVQASHEQPAGPGDVVRIVEPPSTMRPSTPSGPFAGAASSTTLQQSLADRNVPDIAYLPRPTAADANGSTANGSTATAPFRPNVSQSPAGHSASAPARRATPSESGAWTGANASSRSDAPTSSGVSSVGGEYSRDEAYARLQGRLEYSQSTRRWKLRYIRIDGPQDDYGGSVVLNNAAATEGFRPGDFVTVHGRLVPGQSEVDGFAPLFDVQRIARQ